MQQQQLLLHPELHAKQQQQQLRAVELQAAVGQLGRAPFQLLLDPIPSVRGSGKRWQQPKQQWLLVLPWE